MAVKIALTQSAHSRDDLIAQMGTGLIVEELIGRTIRMPGFILPLDAQAAGKAAAG